MAEFEWDPETYLALMAQEVPDYPRLQDQLVTAATERPTSSSVLDLGIGSGLTARRVADALPRAHLMGVDASDAMLAAAARTLDPRRTELRHAQLEDPLPDGPFDLVVSMLAVHHLDAAGKADLFARVAQQMIRHGRLVLADLVTPADPRDVITPIDGAIDTPSPLPEQLTWLSQAGLRPEVRWAHHDLAVIVADRHN